MSLHENFINHEYDDVKITLNSFIDRLLQIIKDQETHINILKKENDEYRRINPRDSE